MGQNDGPDRNALNMMILMPDIEALEALPGDVAFYMAVPALLVTGACMCALQLFLFGQPRPLS